MLHLRCSTMEREKKNKAMKDSLTTTKGIHNISKTRRKAEWVARKAHCDHSTRRLVTWTQASGWTYRAFQIIRQCALVQNVRGELRPHFGDRNEIGGAGKKHSGGKVRQRSYALLGFSQSDEVVGIGPRARVRTWWRLVRIPRLRRRWCWSRWNEAQQGGPVAVAQVLGAGQQVFVGGRCRGLFSEHVLRTCSVVWWSADLTTVATLGMTERIVALRTRQ